MDISSDSLLYTRDFHQEFLESDIYQSEEFSKNEFLVLYVLDGKGMLYYNNILTEIKQGDLVILNLSFDHYYHSDEMEIINFKLGGKIPNGIEYKDYKFSIQGQYKYQEIIENLTDVSNDDLITLIRKFLDFMEEAIKEENEFKHSSYVDVIEDSIRYIKENFDRRINVDDIINVMGISKFHFIRKFKDHYDITPYQYITSLRIEHSKFLLTHTDRQIKEISYDSGFKNEASYIKTFKSKVGITPFVYREDYM